MSTPPDKSDPPQKSDRTRGYDPRADWSEVIQQIQDGDPQGDERLAAFISAGGARYVAARHLDRKHDADDIVQDAYILTREAIRRGDINTADAVPGYVAQIVKRACWKDNTSRHSKGLPIDEPGNLFADRRDNPEKQAIEEQKRDIASEAIGELKPREREILQRFYGDGETQEEIKKKMGLTDNQFRLMKSRAKQKVEESVERRLQAGQRGRLNENAAGFQTAQTDGQALKDSGRDAKAPLVGEILATLPLIRIPPAAHSDAVTRLTDARKELIRAVLNVSEDVSGMDASRKVEEARKRLEMVYSRKLLQSNKNNAARRDMTAIESFLAGQPGKEESHDVGFAARIENERARAEENQRS